MKLRWVIFVAIGLLLVVAATRTVPAFKSDTASLSPKDKVSYAVGMTVATQIRAQSIDIDPDVMTRAFKDALSNGKTLLTYQEARAVMASVQKEVKAKRAALQREKVRFRGQVTAQGDRTAAQLAVSFKLDPRLSGGVYGGDRWVSVPTYTKVGEGRTCTFEARIQNASVDEKAPAPTWTAADPDMVRIDPGQGMQVKLLVQRAGETRVHVESDAGARDLTIKAVYRNNVLQAEISQK